MLCEWALPALVIGICFRNLDLFPHPLSVPVRHRRLGRLWWRGSRRVLHALLVVLALPYLHRGLVLLVVNIIRNQTMLAIF